MNFDANWRFLYNFAPVYFTIMKQSVQDSLILNLINLIEDKGRSDNNINQFIDTLMTKMTEFNYETPECCQIFMVYLDELRVKLLNNLKTWRDKLLVHLDKKYFYDSSRLSTDAPLSFDDLRDVVSNLLKHFCDIYSCFFNVAHTTIHNKSDYKSFPFRTTI